MVISKNGSENKITEQSRNKNPIYNICSWYYAKKSTRTYIERGKLQVEYEKIGTVRNS